MNERTWLTRIGHSVGIECEPEAYEIIAKAASASDFFDAISKNTAGNYLFYYGPQKWNENYVKTGITDIINALNELDQMQTDPYKVPEGYGYAFVQLGYDYTDIAVRKNTDRITYPVIQEIRTEGFDKQIVYEEKQEEKDEF